VLSGSLVRLPLGMLGDRFGGRIVFFVLMLVCVLPIYLIGDATEYWQFLLLGLFVGLAGGSFSVGIAYVAKWFDKANQGLAMGIFGAAMRVRH
jgi:Nitrate/nitrite transporter